MIVMAFVIAAASAACSMQSGNHPAVTPNPVAVEVWTVGDDGLTQRLADAVRREFDYSARFKLAASGTPGALMVTIPTHVGGKGINGKTRVRYRVQFERDRRSMAVGGGACWDADLTVCAMQIVEAAGRAAAR
jgi:hypothetical protein